MFGEICQRRIVFTTELKSKGAANLRSLLQWCPFATYFCKRVNY